MKFCLLDSILLFIIIFEEIVECNHFKVNGRCGRPGLPFKGTLDSISPERMKFDNNERVVYNCPSNEFPHHLQTRTCNNGKWIGPQARCGKISDTQLTHLKLSKCLTEEILGQIIVNQSNKSDSIRRINSYHISRDTSEGIFVKGLECYLYKLYFDKSVRIAFVLIDLIIQNYNYSENIPHLNLNVSSDKECDLQKTTSVQSGSDQIIGYYFFCDYDNNEIANNDYYNKTKHDFSYFSMIINISDQSQEIGIGAVFVGSHYYKKDEPLRPECGEIEIERTGVLTNEENGNNYVRCHDSFEDYWLNRNKYYKFNCDQSGRWIGDWPVCVPQLYCSIKFDKKFSENTIEIESIENAYYINETQWYAINETYLKYKCINKNHVMVGNNVRVCQKSGVWSDDEPICMDPKKANVGTVAFISLLLVIIIILIAIIIIKMNFIKSKKHNQRHNESFNLKANHSNDKKAMANQYSTSLEVYDDVIDESLNEDYSELYEEAFYESAPNSTQIKLDSSHNSEQYLEILEEDIYIQMQRK